MSRCESPWKAWLCQSNDDRQPEGHYSVINTECAKSQIWEDGGGGIELYAVELLCRAPGESL